MDWDPLLIFSGCLAALIFSSTLFFSQVNQKANRFLALLTLSIGLNLLVSWIIINAYFNQYPILHILPYGIGFGLGPTLYLYVRSLTTEQRIDYRHLWWFLADYPHSIYHWIYGRSNFDQPIHEFLDKMGFLSIFLVAFYLWKSRKLILEHQKELRSKLSNVERQTLNWLNQISVLFLILLPISLVLWSLNLTIGLDFDDRITGHVFYVGMIFWLGIGGIRQPEIVSKGSGNITLPATNPVAKKHLDALTACMEKDKLYLLPDLSVRFLEDRLGITAKQISEALNQESGKNFYSFINEYRVAEFKEKVADNPQLTLAGLALDCGFNSKTTFQRVFKEMTGLRPSEYVQSIKQ